MDAVDNAAPSEKGEAAGASSSDAAGASSSDAQPGSAIPVAAGGDAVNEEAPGGDGPDAPLLAAAAIGNTVSVVAMLEDGVSAAPTYPDTPLFVSAGGGCFWQVPVADFAKINAKSRGEALSEFDGVVRWTNYPPLKVDPAIHKKLIDGKAKAWETVTMSVADPIPIMGYGLVKTSDGAVELTAARLPWWFVRFEQEPHILRKVPTAYRTKFLETVDSSSSERQCSLRFEMREGGMSEKNSKGLPPRSATSTRTCTRSGTRPFGRSTAAARTAGRSTSSPTFPRSSRRGRRPRCLLPPQLATQTRSWRCSRMACPSTCRARWATAR